MAAQSPVTIESSPSYEAYRAPSITPDSLRRSASTTSITRSSPQLLSPSFFVRSRPQPLKSGSRIQQVPAGAQAGFATAASIWKQSNAENISVEDGTVTGDLAPVGESRQRAGRNPAAKSTGKLMKPKKTLKSGNAAVRTNTILEDPLDDISLDSREKAPKLKTKVSKSANVEDVSTHGNPTKPRRPSLNFSEYSFNADPLPAQMPSPANVVPPTTSVVRKRVSKKTNTSDVPTTKKPRKSKAKSEAIILDSDEPEEVLDTANLNVTTEMPVASEDVAKKPRQRKTKESSASKGEGEHVTAAPARAAKKRKATERPANGSTKTSAYFEQPPGVDGEHLPSSPPSAVNRGMPQLDAIMIPDEINAATSAAEATAPPAEMAPRRRRSWTPAKDSFPEEGTAALPNMSGDPCETMEQVPFSALLGNFSYLNPETDPSERTTSGEVSTKRRRIELSNQSGVNQPHSADTAKAGMATKAGKSARKPKAVPKKPQTVTALSLAAYQPQKEQDPLQSTVSNYFSPQKEVENLPVAKDGADGIEPTAKAKKPRKSRAKVPLGDGDNAVTKKPAKSKSNATKVKVKFDKTEHVAPLYSPTQACKQMKAQDFIFGTSSQLAADESPDFLRDMQLAIQQSELACPLPRSSQIGTQPDEVAVIDDKSCARVPSAPHGTCLSLEQARRDLWCASARDSTGSKLAPELPPLLPEALSVATKDHFEQVVDVVTLSSSGQAPHVDRALWQQEPSGSEPKSAPPAKCKIPNAFVDPRPTIHSATNEVVPDPQAAEPAHPPPKEDWTILRSDDSVSLPVTTTIKPPEGYYDLATSPARRTVLQSLDANISMVGPDSTKKLANKPHARSFSIPAAALDRANPQIPPSIMEHDTNSPTTVSPKRGRGRPRKVSSPERSVQTSPARGRGRPRKDSSTDATTRTSLARARADVGKDVSFDKTGLPSPQPPVGRPRKESGGARVTSMSPRRSVSQPRKNDTTDRALSRSPERPVEWPRQKATAIAVSPRAFRNVRGGHPSASQPTPQKEWTRIDEISDTESPTTPSPRRRRASSSPAHILPLDFEPPLSPSAMPKVAVAGNAAMKATDATWPAIQASIFPQIAETIKAAPLGEDINTPSWHEKILLYDPIVLEDLTAWLNGQGLRTEVERLKTKNKTRGRKKKDAPPEVDEWETVRDELKAWMVQKWCEDNSICCLWKEGLRGGVKARY